MPKRATLKSVGVTTISLGKYIDKVEFPKKERETNEEYDARIWKEKGHYDSEGYCVIPNMMLKNALVNAAKYNNEKIGAGKGNQTWTNKFKAGILVVNAPRIRNPETGKYYTKKTVACERRPVGKGDKPKPICHFPIFPKWETDEFEVIILDDIINEDVFHRFLDDTGKFVGLGRYRVGLGGMYGSFRVEDFQWHGDVE
jgi:hypothetical protein